jgi:hypothetical protein
MHRPYKNWVCRRSDPIGKLFHYLYFPFYVSRVVYKSPNPENQSYSRWRLETLKQVMVTVCRTQQITWVCLTGSHKSVTSWTGLTLQLDSKRI